MCAGLQSLSRPMVMLKHVILQLLRAVFLGLSIYGLGYGHVALAWLFGILFIHSLLDSGFYRRPGLTETYLLFTVVFYFHRYVMGWGAPTTIYRDDAPDWVKAFKDVIWALFVLAITAKAALRLRFDRSVRLWFSLRGRVMIILVLLYCLLPAATLLFRPGRLFDGILYAVRYPLEYAPFVFLFPFILEGKSSLRYLRSFIPLILITLLFLAYEVFSGRPTGFGGQSFYVRYGSIFGSPNDFGVFLMLSITVMLAFLVERAVRLTLKLAVLLALCLGALAGTVSLSAIFAMVFSGLALALFTRRKLATVLAIVLIASFAAGLYFSFPGARATRYLSERIEDLSSLRERSAYQHYLSVVDAERDIAHFSSTEYLVGTFDSPAFPFLPETYYLRTLYSRGVPSLVVLLLIIGLSIWEAHWRYRAASGNPVQRGLFLGLQVAVASFAFAALFIPYFDIFPSNFYFWFLVALIWSEPEMKPKSKASEIALEKASLLQGGTVARA